MNWTELTNAMAAYLEEEQPSDAYLTARPRIIEAAELYLYRTLDLAAASSENFDLTLTANSPYIDMRGITAVTIADGTPVRTIIPVEVQGLAARVGNRWVPFVISSLDWVSHSWPDPTVTGVPRGGVAYFAMLDDRTAKIAPVPDQSYPARITATWRPLGISEANPTTWLGDNMPDLLLSACIVEARAFHEDAEMTQMWAAKLAEQLKGAGVEEQVRQGHGPGYQATPPAPLAGS